MLGHCAISECPISALPEVVEDAPGGAHGKPGRRKKPRGPRLVQTTHPDRPRPRLIPAPPRLLPRPAPRSTRAAPIDAPPSALSDEEALAVILAARLL